MQLPMDSVLSASTEADAGLTLDRVRALVPGATFRLQANAFFLTYPKADCKQRIFDELCDPSGKWVPIFLKVSLEHHADGSPHCHAIVQYSRRRDVTSSRCFDVGDFHCNVGRLIDPGAADKYLSKEDTSPLVMGSLVLNSRHEAGKKPSRDNVMFDLFESSSSKEEFLTKVRNSLTYTYFTNFERLSSAASTVFKSKPSQYSDPFPGHPWVLPGAVKKWLREEFPKKERARALCLIGPSRFGKTAWARSLGRHIFWRQSTNLDTWDDEALYLVLDDIDWKYLPNKKCWLTAMGDMTVTDRYRAKRDICNYKPAIYLVNPEQDPRLHFETGEESYWEANMDFVVLTKSLINTVNPLFQ